MATVKNSKRKRDGTGEMKCTTQKKYLERQRKKKRDRLRRLLMKKVKKNLSKAEKQELQQLQIELQS